MYYSTLLVPMLRQLYVAGTFTPYTNSDIMPPTRTDPHNPTNQNQRIFYTTILEQLENWALFVGKHLQTTSRANTTVQKCT